MRDCLAEEEVEWTLSRSLRRGFDGMVSLSGWWVLIEGRIGELRFLALWGWGVSCELSALISFWNFKTPLYIYTLF